MLIASLAPTVAGDSAALGRSPGPGGPAAAGGQVPPGDRSEAPVPTVRGPIPGTLPGDRSSSVLEETYPFF